MGTQAVSMSALRESSKLLYEALIGGECFCFSILLQVFAIAIAIVFSITYYLLA